MVVFTLPCKRRQKYKAYLPKDFQILYYCKEFWKAQPSCTWVLQSIGINWFVQVNLEITSVQIFHHQHNHSSALSEGVNSVVLLLQKISAQKLLFHEMEV